MCEVPSTVQMLQKVQDSEQWRFIEGLEKQWKERNFMLWFNSYFYTLFWKSYSYIYFRASLIAWLVKNPPAMQETLVRSLGWEDPLDKETATHSSILENSMDCIVHGARKSWTWLSDFPCHIYFVLFLKKTIIIFWLCQVLAATLGIFSFGMKTLSCGNGI